MSAGDLIAADASASTSNKRNKRVAGVRVWKRRDRGGRWYCTIITSATAKPVHRACGTRHRSMAEDVATLLLKQACQTQSTPGKVADLYQLELRLPPPKRPITRPESV